MSVIKEDIEDAAEGLIAGADYLKTCLDEDKEIYESQWFDAMMRAHGVLLQLADAAMPNEIHDHMMSKEQNYNTREPTPGGFELTITIIMLHARKDGADQLERLNAFCDTVPMHQLGSLCEGFVRALTRTAAEDRAIHLVASTVKRKK